LLFDSDEFYVSILTLKDVWPPSDYCAVFIKLIDDRNKTSDYWPLNKFNSLYEREKLFIENQTDTFKLALNSASAISASSSSSFFDHTLSFKNKNRKKEKIDLYDIKKIRMKIMTGLNRNAKSHFRWTFKRVL
jgi:hypothetical protein